MDEIIKTKNLTKNFKASKVNLNVLQNINLKIYKSEFVSIMGPSGSGKSTLLYLLGGLDKPSFGSVIIKGTKIESLNNKQISILRRRTIGFIFQFYNLLPNLNVEENIILPVILDGGKLKDYKFKLKEVIEDVGLTSRLKHIPAELSGGQQQRVAIARALINDPEIILADELTGNLDSITSREILNLLRRINLERKKTIVMVTHSLEAAACTDRIIYLKDGILQEDLAEKREEPHVKNVATR